MSKTKGLHNSIKLLAQYLKPYAHGYEINQIVVSFVTMGIGL